MGQHLYTRLEREGFCFVAGFSNENSHRLMTGPLGRTPVRPFPWCVRLLSPLRLARSFLHGPLPERIAPAFEPRIFGSYLVSEAEAGDPRIDRLWQRARDTVRVGAVRDSAFTTWRYASRPEARYRFLLAERGGDPAGFIAHRSLDMRGVRGGFVLDLLLAPGEEQAGRVLLRAVAELSRAEGAVLLSALLPSPGPVRTALLRAGFLRVPERLHPQLIRFSVRGLGAWARSPLLVDSSAWHLSWSDTEVV